MGDRRIEVDLRWGSDVACQQRNIQTGSRADVGNRTAVLGVKRPESRGDHSPPPNAEVKVT